jgi:hypothetical protein
LGSSLFEDDLPLDFPVDLEPDLGLELELDPDLDFWDFLTELIMGWERMLATLRLLCSIQLPAPQSAL